MAREKHDLTVDGTKVGTIETDTGEPVTPFMLHLVFDTGFQTEIEVTKYEPLILWVDSGHQRIVSAKIEQKSLFPGMPIAQFVDWSRVIFVGASSIEEQ